MKKRTRIFLSVILTPGILIGCSSLTLLQASAAEPVEFPDVTEPKIVESPTGIVPNTYE